MAGARKTNAANNDLCIEYAIQGFSKAVLAKLFQLDRSTIQRHLKGIPSDGMRSGYPIFKVARVAPVLLKVIGLDNEEALNNPDKMKPSDRKDHWQAVQAEQKAMESSGDLWHTEKVIELVSQSFKHIKLSVQLFSDIVERESSLTEDQIKTIQGLSDNLLEDMRERLLSGLSEED